MNVHSSSLMRFAQRLFLTLGFLTLAYTNGTVAYAELYQRYQSWKFEYKIDTTELTKAGVTIQESLAGSADLEEGDLIGKLEIPQIGISVTVLQGVSEDTLRVGVGHVPGTPLPGA